LDEHSDKPFQLSPVIADLENAFFWCRGKVVVSAVLKGKSVAIITEDDGPGLSPDRWKKRCKPASD
jgi:hypothetical protein